MLKSINIFLFLFSLVMFFYAPEDYSFVFCLIINLSFLIQNFLYFFLSRRSLVSFEFFFMFAFYFVNFIYPVAYFPTNPTFGIFEYEFNYKIICKATAIAFVAYSAYMMGLSLRKSEFDSELQLNSSNFSKSFFTNLLIVFAGLAISYIISVGTAFFSGYEWYVDEDNYSPVLTFISMSASLFAMFLFFQEKVSKRNLYIFLILLFIGVYLLSGSRNMPLGLLSILVVVINEKVRKIPSVVFLLSIIAGMVIFYVISLVRVDSILEATDIGGTLSAGTENSVFDFASDLISNNRNLYVLVDYADNISYTYGLTMLSSFLGLVPYAGTFVSNVFGIPIDFMYVAGFNTFLEFGFGSTWGLGGNMVADVYLAFGFPGIIIFFFFLGTFLSKVIRSYKQNIVYYIIYFIFVGSAVFMNRESFFLPLRSILYSLLMFWVLNRLFRNVNFSNSIKPKTTDDE